MRTSLLFILLLLSGFVFGQNVPIKQIVNIDDSLTNRRSERYEPDNFINRLVNSPMPSSYAAFHPKGFNEFDLRIDPSDGQKIIVFDARDQLRWIKFTTDADLQSKVGTASDIVIKTAQNSYPSLVIENGRYYIFYHTPSNDILLIEGANTTELAAATPVTVWDHTATGISVNDWSVRKNPVSGGYITGGYVGSVACIWTSPSLYGNWTLQGQIFWDANSTGHISELPGLTNHADGMIFFKGKRCFYMSNNFNITALTVGTDLASHCSIAEIDLKDYKVIGRPVEFLKGDGYSFYNSFGAGPFPYNPVYLQNGQKDEIWFVGSTGTIGAPDTGYLAHYQIGIIDSVGVRGDNITTNIADARAGYTKDGQSNIIHKTYGIVTNTVSGGIATSSSNSGVWNYLSRQSINQFDIFCRFKVTSLPAGQAVIFSMGSTIGGTANYITLTIDSIGKLHFKYRNSTTVDFILSGTVSTGVITNFSASNRRWVNKTFGFKLGYSLITINGTGTPLLNTGGAWTPVMTYSLMNDSSGATPVGGTNALGRQLNGAIYAFEVNEAQPEPFIRNTQIAPVMQQDFNIAGTGEMFLSKATKLALRKSGYGWQSSEPGMQLDSTLGLYVTVDASLGYGIINNAGAFAFQVLGANTYLQQSAGMVDVGHAVTPTALMDVAGSTTARASGRVRSGTAPTSPNDGEYWNDATTHHFMMRLNGVTYQIDQQTGSGVTTIGTINSQTKSANGAVISGANLVMQTVDHSQPGLMTAADKIRLDSNTFLKWDSLYTPLGGKRNDSTGMTKSIRIQVNGTTITPSTSGDSASNWNIANMDVYQEGTTTSGTTITPPGDQRVNFYDITALATNPTIAAPSGTPANHNYLVIRIKDNGTSRTITWNSIYRAGTDFALPTTTTISKDMYVAFFYNTGASKWDAVGSSNGF